MNTTGRAIRDILKFFNGPRRRDTQSTSVTAFSGHRVGRRNADRVHRLVTRTSGTMRIASSTRIVRSPHRLAFVYLRARVRRRMSTIPAMFLSSRRDADIVSRSPAILQTKTRERGVGV